MEIGITTNEPGSVAKPFHCTICPKSFVHEFSLEEHILNKHVEDKEFQCTECLETNQLVKSFGTQRILTKHIKRTHRIGPPRFKCRICFKTYNYSSNFSTHMQTHFQTGMKRHKKCDLCSKTFRFKYQLESHLFYIHKRKREDVKYLKCELCSQEFLQRCTLEKHVVRQHVVDKAFECSICSKTFIDKQTLDKHMKGHDRQKKHFCDVCSQGFKVKNNFVIHLGVKHNRFFYCDKCLRSFSNKRDFDEHISDSKQALNCDICQELINSECNLKIHTDSHVKEIKAEVKDNGIIKQIKSFETDAKFKPKSTIASNSEKFPCELCSKCFDRETYFRAHRKEVHQNAEWKCNFGDCSKTYKRHDQFRLHQMVHAETKEFVCNICGKSFYRPDSLKAHQKVHLKERKYKCEHCPKSFSSPFRLRTHIAHNHGGVKPFKCPFVNCETYWANNAQLNSHLISHQTDKSFECELCPAFIAFKTLDQLKLHQRRVHIETKKNKARTGLNKTFARKRKSSEKNAIFICSSSACSFETVNEKDVALHYSEQHGLPKVVLSRNIISPAAMSKKPQEMRSMIRKKFKCDICFKLFKSTETFSAHQVVHSNVIPVKCPVCPKSFKFKGNLKRHVKKCHQNTQHIL